MHSVTPGEALALVGVALVERRAIALHVAKVTLAAVAHRAMLVLVKRVAEYGALPLDAADVALGELVLAGAVVARLAGAAQAVLLLVLLLTEGLALLHDTVVRVWQRLASRLRPLHTEVALCTRGTARIDVARAVTRGRSVASKQ